MRQQHRLRLLAAVPSGSVQLPAPEIRPAKLALRFELHLSLRRWARIWQMPRPRRNVFKSKYMW